MGGIDRRSLGSFSVDELGRISLQDGEAGGFGFRWRGRPVALEVRNGAAAGTGSGTAPGCRIRITAQAGRVPSSALAAERRPDALQLARLLGGALPEGWRARLLADHRLEVETEESLPFPALIGELLVPATRFAIRLGPYLDLLDEHGMTMTA